MGNSHKFNNHRWGAGCAHWVGKNDSEDSIRLPNRYLNTDPKAPPKAIMK